MKPFKKADEPANATGFVAASNNESDSEEDDYMKMTFTDTPPTTIETSLQRRQRERREAAARGRVKSKAEFEAEAEAKREEALSKSLLADDPNAPKKSKGLSMMAKMGFTGGTLGSKDNVGARAEPIRINVKDGREGIGLESERKRKLREAAEAAGETAKKVKVDENEYRERMRLEREEQRLGKQLYAAQKVAERMDDEKACATSTGTHLAPTEEDDGNITTNDTSSSATKPQRKQPISARPLKSLPVVYRGMVRAREEAERLRRMRHDLEQSSSIAPLSRLPTYVDPDEDADDKMALGKNPRTELASTTYVTADDLDDEDEELAAFEALDLEEKLRKTVVYMREEHRYCFWCKFAYPDVEMEGCPGLEEEDHD